MKTVSSMILICVLFFSASLAAEYCTSDDAGNTVGCSMMVSTGDPMEPVIAFTAKREGETRTWNLGVRVLQR